jgi:hypothetical protein
LERVNVPNCYTTIFVALQSSVYKTLLRLFTDFLLNHPAITDRYIHTPIYNKRYFDDYNEVVPEEPGKMGYMSERGLRMGEWNNRRKWNMQVGRRRHTFQNRAMYIYRVFHDLWTLLHEVIS